MPILENPKHEKFAQLVARGKSQVAAYITAGFSNRGAHGNASRLIANDIISQRILELQQAQLQICDDNSRQILNEINILIEKASNMGQYHAAIKGMALKMRFLGLL